MSRRTPLVALLTVGVLLAGCARDSAPSSPPDAASPLGAAPWVPVPDRSGAVPDFLLEAPGPPAASAAGGLAPQANGSYPGKVGSSPFAFDDIEEPSDTFVVNDRGSATIDRYLYGSGEPPHITIPLSIRRYVGPTDAEGHLQNVDELIANGIVGPTATVYMPIYDVDADATPVLDCDGDGIDDVLASEQDAVYFNGEPAPGLSHLVGQNATWVMNRFTVDIREIRFPSSPGATAQNDLTIHIDEGNREIPLSSGQVGCQVWAVEVDWVALRFEAMSPVVFVHGIRDSADRWSDSGYEAFLTDRHLVADGSLTLSMQVDPDPPATCDRTATGGYVDPYNDSVGRHVDEMRDYIRDFAERHGTDAVHLIAHSKGGIDSRAFIRDLDTTPLEVEVGTMAGASVRRPLEVRSLVTHSTPHAGSALADYGMLSRRSWLLWSPATTAPALVARSQEGDYYCALSTAVAEEFNAATLPPTDLQTLAIGTDADIDDDGSISTAEAAGVVDDSILGIISPGVQATIPYGLLGDVESVSLQTFAGVPIGVIEEPTAEFRENDIAVTVRSAHSWPRASTALLDDHNHTTIVSDPAVQDRIYSDATNAGGDLDWRLR